MNLNLSDLKSGGLINTEHHILYMNYLTSCMLTLHNLNYKIKKEPIMIIETHNLKNDCQYNDVNYRMLMYMKALNQIIISINKGVFNLVQNDFLKILPKIVNRQLPSFTFSGKRYEFKDGDFYINNELIENNIYL